MVDDDPDHGHDHKDDKVKTKGGKRAAKLQKLKKKFEEILGKKFGMLWSFRKNRKPGLKASVLSAPGKSSCKNLLACGYIVKVVLPLSMGLIYLHDLITK